MSQNTNHTPVTQEDAWWYLTTLHGFIGAFDVNGANEWLAQKGIDTRFSPDGDHLLVTHSDPAEAPA